MAKISDTMKKVITPIALGIISDPPTIVLKYDSEESGKQKRRKRKIPLRNFNDHSDVTKTVFSLQKRHSDYLLSVPTITLEKMIRIIQEVQKGLYIEEAVVKVHQEYEINPNQDLNKLSTIELSRKKEIMDETFLKTFLKPGDPGFVYDKEINFDKPVKKDNAWDDDDSEAHGNSSSKTGTTEKLDNQSEAEPVLNQLEDKTIDNDNGVFGETGKAGGDFESTTKSEVDVGKKMSQENSVELNRRESLGSILDEEIDDEDFW